MISLLVAQGLDWEGAVPMQPPRFGLQMSWLGGLPQISSCLNGQERLALMSPSSSLMVPHIALAGGFCTHAYHVFGAVWLQVTASAVTSCRGEVVEDVEPPLPLDTPLLLVKPVVGLATPEIFKLLDLSKCSKADPKELLQQMKHAGRLTQDMCVNDLERPAFAR